MATTGRQEGLDEFLPAVRDPDPTGRHGLSTVWDRDRALTPVGDLMLVVLVEGSLVATRENATEHLAPRDALLLEGRAPVAIAPSPRAEILVIDLWRREPPPLAP